MRTDQPRVTDDGLADGESLPERAGDRDELRRRLQRLPPGHPSSPVEADGTPRPPEPGLGCREPSVRDRARAADRGALTDAEHAEHVSEVRALLDKARADGLATDEVIAAQADAEWGSRNRKTFEQLKPLLDAWLQCDNSVDGRRPVLVDSGGREEGKR